MKYRIPCSSLLTLASFALGASCAWADPVVETVHVVIASGPNAGTWDVSTDRAGCSAGLTGPGSFGNQFSLSKEKDPKKFASLQLIVPDAKAAASGAKEFLIVFRFGPLMGPGTEYTVETRAREPKKTGSGTVTVLDKGATALVNFAVTTATGVKIDGTIDCKTVIRAPA